MFPSGNSRQSIRVPRGRQALRGPFGQMLDAQMNKSDVIRRSNNPDILGNNENQSTTYSHSPPMVWGKPYSGNDTLLEQ